MTKMIGTSGALFTVVKSTKLGRVGYREIDEDGGLFRIRVEPTYVKGELRKLRLPKSWKTPSDGYNRYSTVVGTKSGLTTALKTAKAAIMPRPVAFATKTAGKKAAAKKKVAAKSVKPKKAAKKKY